MHSVTLLLLLPLIGCSGDTGDTGVPDFNAANEAQVDCDLGQIWFEPERGGFTDATWWFDDGVVDWSESGTLYFCAGTHDYKYIQVTGDLWLDLVGLTDDPADVVLDARGAGRHLDVAGGTVTVRDLTLTGGWSSEDGGAIACSGGNVNVRNATIDGSSARSGGGLYAANCHVDLDEVEVKQNHSTGDGAGLALVDTTGLVRTTNFSDNNADTSGGGLSVSGSQANIELDTVSFTGGVAAHSGTGTAGALWVAPESTLNGTVVTFGTNELAGSWEPSDLARSETTSVEVLVDQAIDFWCVSGENRCQGQDHDGDEYSVLEGDCDDADATLHPAAAVVLGDGVDDNCTGADEVSTSYGEITLSGTSGSPCADPDTYYAASKLVITGDSGDASSLWCVSGVTGAVLVQDSDLADMSGLASLSSVGGDLTVERSPNFVDFEGLDSLTTVSGTLQVKDSGAVKSLAGLGSLTSLGGLSIEGSSSLADLSSLSGISAMSGLSLSGIAGLSDLADLAGLTSLGDLQLDDLQDLTSLSGLESITTLASVSLSDLPQVQDLTPLGSVTRITGDLALSEMALADLDDLSSLSSFSGSLSLHSTSMTKLGRLAWAKTIADLKLTENASLTDLDGLDWLYNVYGEVKIDDNDGLGSLTGLESLSTVGGDAAVWSNDSLTDITALLGLATVDGEFSIHGNGNLCQSYVDAVFEDTWSYLGESSLYNNDGC